MVGKREWKKDCTYPFDPATFEPAAQHYTGADSLSSGGVGERIRKVSVRTHGLRWRQRTESKSYMCKQKTTKDPFATSHQQVSVQPCLGNQGSSHVKVSWEDRCSSDSELHRHIHMYTHTQFLFPSCYCWTWHNKVWDVSSASLGQLSWLCPIPAPDSLPTSSWQGSTRRWKVLGSVQTLLCNTYISMLSPLVSSKIQNTALCEPLWRKLSLSQQSYDTSTYNL